MDRHCTRRRIVSRQRQKSLARLYIGIQPIVDELNPNLDDAGEAALVDAIGRMEAGPTVIVVSRIILSAGGPYSPQPVGPASEVLQKHARAAPNHTGRIPRPPQGPRTVLPPSLPKIYFERKFMKNPFAAPSTSEQPWMHDDLGMRNFGYLVVGLFLFVMVMWAAFAPIESAAIAPGVVQVEGNTKPIQHLEGGRVSEILVALGESVTAGQPLLLLDAKKDRAEKEILQGRIFNLVARVTRLKLEMG